MIGKSDVADLAAFFFLCDPLFHTDLLQFFPLIDIGDHMHQIIIDIVCAETF